MNKESFIQVLRNPKSISEDQLTQVEDVVEQFPYFQIARSVIACGSKSLSRGNAQSKLAQAAIYTTNRQLLKKYVSGQFDFEVVDSIQIGIHRDTQKKTLGGEETTEPSSTRKRAKFRVIERRNKYEESAGSSGKFVDVTKKSEVEDIDEELTIIDKDGVERTTVTHTSSQTAKEESKQDLVEQEESSTASKEEVERPVENTTASPNPSGLAEDHDTKKTGKILSKDVNESVEKIKETRPEAPRLTSGELVDDVFKNLEQYRQSRNHYLEVEQNILNKQESDAIEDAVKKASTKVEDEDTAIEEPVKEEPIVEVEVPKVEVPKKEETVLPKPAEKSKTTEVVPVKKEKTSSLKKPIKEASEKIKITRKPSTPVEEPKVAEPDSAIEMDPEKVDNDIISDSVKTSSQSQHADNTDKKEVQKEIIEKFIKTNPKILPADEEPKGEIADLSTPSAEMNEDLATENLAIILSRQGKRDKAIEIYEKLIMKIPKKKSYFAARISELK